MTEPRRVMFRLQKMDSPEYPQPGTRKARLVILTEDGVGAYDCGGGNGWHVAPDFWRDTPGCSINELPDEERMAAEDAARERLLAYSDSISKGWLT